MAEVETNGLRCLSSDNGTSKPSPRATTGKHAIPAMTRPYFSHCSHVSPGHQNPASSDYRISDSRSTSRRDSPQSPSRCFGHPPCSPVLPHASDAQMGQAEIVEKFSQYIIGIVCFATIVSCLIVMFGFPKFFGWRGRSLNLAISSLGSLDFLLFGYDQGVTGGLLDLPSFTKYFPDINPEDPAIARDKAARSQRSLNQGIAVASYNLGCFFGAILTIFIGNPLGRRKTIFCGCIIMATGALLQTTAFHLPHFIIARIITGVGNGMNTSTVPTWQSESSKAHDRGKMVMIEGMLITAGITLSYWINYGMSFIPEHEAAWRFPLAFQILFAVVIFTSILNLPESPRWLVMQGRTDDALEVLECLNEKSRDDPYIKSELKSIEETVREMSKGSYRSLFQMSEYREFHRVALAYINQMFQQISGINLITYYAPSLYREIGLGDGNLPKLLAACNGTEYLMAAFIPIFIIEKVGRRPLMLFGAAGMSISMAVLAGTNYRLKALEDKQAGIGQAVFLFVFNTFFAIGWLGMTWLYPAEIVPLRIRAPTNALATSANWIFNFMVVMITPVAFENIGYQTYIIFAVINAFIFPFVYFFFPETRYRSLEEMDAIFKKSTNVFNAVTVSIKEPYHYDKHGQLKPEYLEEAIRRDSVSVHAADKTFDSDEPTTEVKA